ncbi:DUF6344 domain-containing protein [Streptomyces tirandamycinicus]|uniref:DUF6344 domain-containing protein n=1 Tax=Streptomyces tirandamycinicus TaxID=2174846 RepID=UPI00035E5759|nr:DUF6344 domain-containing protein [Streptomyces tirandamycinicus]MCY0980008.1 DUF6344 domain-containing protein [Streptomyces tirandamycinicus]
MAAVKVTSLWTAFVSLIVTLLSSLGFTSSAKAAEQSAGPRQPESPAERKPTVPGARSAGNRAGAHEPPAGAGSAPATAAGTYGSLAMHGFWHQVVRQRTPRDRALPPTIKQRIRAEAHGASPAVRKVPTLDDMAEAQREPSYVEDEERVPAAA